MISPQASPPNRDGEGPANGGGSPKRQFFSAFDQQDEVLEDDIAEDCLPQTDQKKRKLTVEQVQFLEASFECENKLDPDRKTLIAKQLGLPQRQVAVWFQNRRARSKNKQLEKDHLVLKAECDALAKENIKLKDEIVRLTKLLHSRDTSKLVVKGGGTSESWGEGVEILQPEPGSKTKKQVGVKIEVEVSTDHEVLGSSSSSKCEVVDFIAMSPPSLKLDDSIQLSSDDQELQFMSSVCNPCMLAQQLTLSGCLTDDNYNLFFAQWDETSLFPWWERLQSSLPVNLNASIDPITFPAAPP